MKIFHSLALAAAALSATAVAASSNAKQLYHVTAPASAYAAAMETLGDDLDVWKVTAIDANTVRADIYAEESVMARFRAPTAKSKFNLAANTITVERDPVDVPTMLMEHEQVRASCKSGTSDWLGAVATQSSYLNSAYFDCWRQADEVFAFLDVLVAENPSFITKIASVTTTYEGRAVPGYKISTGMGRKTLYTQGLIHAREWEAGSSTVYTMAGLLDGLRQGKADVVAIFEEYDWHFVPILNLDGFLWSWSSDRMWRKNRRPVTGAIYGVDLNRNYGPYEWWVQNNGSRPRGETYGGTAVLSEPETAGSWAYIKSLPDLRGAIDMHAFGGLVLRPYGNRMDTPPAPIGPKLKALGDGVTNAANSVSDGGYGSYLSAELYVAFGCFDDSIWLEYEVPVLTIEMKGDDFIASENTIRPGGEQILRALTQFAKEVSIYHST